MRRKPLICVPILHEESKHVMQSVESAIKLGADIIEFRIDALQHPDEDDVRKLIANIDHPLIVTNRMQKEGGYFNGSEKERVSILLEAAQYADIVDIELQTNEKLRQEVIEASKCTIVSYHNFKCTPSVNKIQDIVKKEQEIGDIAKFAVMPQNYKDTLTVLNVLVNVENTIGISMGEIGKYTRLVAPILGSPITFASINNKSAPGQLDIQITREFLQKIW